MEMISENGAEVKSAERKKVGEGRQKRYSLKQKALCIEYMLNREESEKKANAAWYAERNDVSRTTLYKLCNEFKAKFSEQQPGPKAVKAIERELANGPEEQDQEKNRRKPESDTRILRTILQAAVSPLSSGEISAVVREALGIKISKRKIKAIIAEYGKKARRILTSLKIEDLVKVMAIDEIFCGKKPVLTGVELRSFALVVGERAKSRRHEEWLEVLQRFPYLELVTSDRATGIAKAVGIRGIWQQFDLFHFKKSAHAHQRRVETWAYDLIEAEYAAQRKLASSRTDDLRHQWQEKYTVRKQEALAAISIFDQIERALRIIDQALDIFDHDGKFQEPGKSLQNLDYGASLLQKASPDAKTQNLAAQVRDPKLFLYLTFLQDALLSLPLQWQKGQPPLLRNKVMQIIANHWHWYNQKTCHVYRHKGETHQAWQIRKDAALQRLYATQMGASFQLRQVQMCLANFDQVFAQVTQALNNVFRSSSLVESLNSHLRVCQQVKKGLHRDFLSLLALYWNMRPFAGGKRKGQSPFQILGIQVAHEHWLDLLLATESL